jgi:transcriptional regulator with XRE-family HTH domain
MGDNPDGWNRWLQRKVQRVAFGKQLRALREAAGVSQPQLGARIGSDGRTIQRWESLSEDAERPPVELGDVAAIASALGCSVVPLINSLLPDGQQLVDEIAFRQLASRWARGAADEAIEELVRVSNQVLSQGELYAWMKELVQLPPTHRAVLADLASAFNRDQRNRIAYAQAAAERRARSAQGEKR